MKKGESNAHKILKERAILLLKEMGCKDIKKEHYLKREDIKVVERLKMKKKEV